MFLSVIFLTLIVSMGAMILLHANAKVQQRNSTLYLTAINLANAQFAEIERWAASDKSEGAETFLIQNILEYADDLKSYNGLDPKKIADGTATPIEFSVDVQQEIYSGELWNFTVTVKWTVGGEEKSVTSKKILRIQ